MSSDPGVGLRLELLPFGPIAVCSQARLLHRDVGANQFPFHRVEGFVRHQHNPKPACRERDIGTHLARGQCGESVRARIRAFLCRAPPCAVPAFGATIRATGEAIGALPAMPTGLVVFAPGREGRHASAVANDLDSSGRTAGRPVRSSAGLDDNVTPRPRGAANSGDAKHRGVAILRGRHTSARCASKRTCVDSQY